MTEYAAPELLVDTAWLNATRILGGMGSVFTGVMFLSIVRVSLRQIYNRGASPDATIVDATAASTANLVPIMAK